MSPSHPFLHRRYTGPSEMRAPHPCIAVVAVVLAAMTPACTGARSGDRAPLVLAAASTIDALESALGEYEQTTGTPVAVSFASTATLARQIEQGAPADLLLAASADWADYVEQVTPVAQRLALVGNRLVVVAPAESTIGELPLTDLVSGAPIERIAIADPSSVPAGVYVSEALHELGLWDAIQPRLVPTVDVRAALALAAAAQVDAAFVYATDAASTPRVRIVARVDSQLHEPIEYPLLLLQGAREGAAPLFEFLASARGRAHFYDRGFAEPGG